jgi:predicted PurR-regulated permease PerM
MESSPATQVTAGFVIVFIVLVACQVAQSVVEPFVFALFIIEIAWPIQKALQPKLGKAAALALTVAATAAVALALFSVVAWEGRVVADWVVQNLDRIQGALISSTSWLEQHDIFVFALVADHFNPAAIIRMVHALAIRANTTLAFAIIVLIYVILGLTETAAFQLRIESLKNQEAGRRLLAGGTKIGEKFRTYIYVRTIASIATGFAVWAFVRFMGLELAGAWGVLAFALNYLPYIGSFIVTALPPVFAFVQFGSFETSLMVLLGIMFIQFVIGSYLEPLFSGSALSISPPLVLLSVALWTYLWGALGAFLGVPLAIAALTMCEQFPSTRWIADLLSAGPPRSSSADRTI